MEHQNNSSIVNIHSILPKIRNRKILREFVFSLGFNLPDLTIYSHDFVLRWGSGNKQVGFLLFSYLKLDNG